METMVKINGIEFYYNTNELDINDYIEILKSFIGEDNAYTLYIDKSQGLVIY